MRSSVLVLMVLALLAAGCATTRTQQSRSGATAGVFQMSGGCCSYHDGVCGCSAGRVVCCDGSLSPSCRC